MLGSKCCCTNYRCDDIISGTEGFYEFKIDTDGGTNNFGPREINISYQSGNGEEVYGASIEFSLYSEDNELLFSKTVSDIGQYPKVFTQLVPNIPTTGTILLRVNATLPSDYDGFAPAIKWHFYVACRGYLRSYCLSGADYIQDDNGDYIPTNALPETVTVTLQAEDYSITVPRVGYKRRRWKYTDWDLIPEHLRGTEIGWRYALLDMGWGGFPWEPAIRFKNPDCTNIRFCEFTLEWGKRFEWADEEEVYEYESKSILPGSAYSGTFELSKIAAYNDDGEFINYYWQYSFGDAFPYGGYEWYYSTDSSAAWTDPPAAITFNPFSVPDRYMETSTQRTAFSFSNASYAPGFLDRVACNIRLTNVKRHTYLWRKGEEDCAIAFSMNPENLHANSCVSHNYLWPPLYSIDPVNNYPEFEDVVIEDNSDITYYPYYGSIPINRDLGKGAPISIVYGYYNGVNNINSASIWTPESEGLQLTIGEFTQEFIDPRGCASRVDNVFPTPSKFEIGESYEFGQYPRLGQMVTYHPGYWKFHNEEYGETGFLGWNYLPWMGGYLTMPTVGDWTPRLPDGFLFVINPVEPFKVSSILGYSGTGGQEREISIYETRWRQFLVRIDSDYFPCAFPAKAFVQRTYLDTPPTVDTRREMLRSCQSAAFIDKQIVVPGNTYKNMILEEGDPRMFLERVDVTFEDLGGEEDEQ